MKIAVISDTHDHLENTVKAVEAINASGAELLIHCGDLCSPFVIDRLSAFNGIVHVVFGNNDGDRFTINRVAERFENIRIEGEAGIIETPDGDIAFAHKPELARGFACTQNYLAVFYGHTHRHSNEKVNGTPFINPGEVMGLLEEPGWVLFDTSNGTSRRFLLERVKES